MPSRRRTQPARPAVVADPPAAVKQPAAKRAQTPMLPAILAAAVGSARHDRHLAGMRLGASRRLGALVRALRPQATAADPTPVSAQARQHDIEVAAYYRWQQRGGGFGSPEGDWFAAEQDWQKRS